MKTIYVLSRKMIEFLNPVKEEDHLILSIHRPEDPPADVKVNSHTVDVMYLQFDDIDLEDDIFQAISSKQAQEVSSFLKEKHKNIDSIICQCDAGVSRSAGMAAAISKYFNGTDKEFFPPPSMYSRPCYRPNMTVYRRVLKALQGNDF